MTKQIEPVTCFRSQRANRAERHTGSEKIATVRFQSHAHIVAVSVVIGFLLCFAWAGVAPSETISSRASAAAAGNTIGSNVVSSVPVEGRLLAKSDLVPYTPPGYPYPVVPSSVPGTHEVDTLYAGAPTYFDWHFANIGDGPAPGIFYVELWVGETRYLRYAYSGLTAGSFAGLDDWLATIPTPGWHMVRLVVDADNDIPESDETNNVWGQAFRWDSSSGHSVYIPLLMRGR